MKCSITQCCFLLKQTNIYVFVCLRLKFKGVCLQRNNQHILFACTAFTQDAACIEEIKTIEKSALPGVQLSVAQPSLNRCFHLMIATLTGRVPFLNVATHRVFIINSVFCLCAHTYSSICAKVDATSW